ncbi:hypothetical protein [Wolbachia endosymbiont (group A) of Agelastica alni]|uniref:hypothetical protein n=1 Tax=Wolbachia endosymbiont (group A) of Agelastica alni TaxID=3066130 RepID=UPI0031333962
MPTNSDDQGKISLKGLESAVVDMLCCRDKYKLKGYESGRGVAELSKENTDIIDKYIECVGKPSERFIKAINEAQIRYLLILDNLNPDTIEKYVNEGKIDILRGYIKSIGSRIEYISKVLEKCGNSDDAEMVRLVLARKLERIEEASKLDVRNQRDLSASTDLSGSRLINKANNQNQGDTNKKEQGVQSAPDVKQQKGVPNPQTEVKIKASIYKTYCALSGGAIIGAAIAYLAGAAALTPVVAVAVFIAATVVGALVGYGIGKFCEKVSEEKQNDPDMSMCTAIKNVLTPECLTSQSQVHP